MLKRIQALAFFAGALILAQPLYSQPAEAVSDSTPESEVVAPVASDAAASEATPAKEPEATGEDLEASAEEKIGGEGAAQSKGVPTTAATAQEEAPVSESAQFAAEGTTPAVEPAASALSEPPVAEESREGGEVAESKTSAESKKAWSATIAHSFGWGLQLDDAAAYSYGQFTGSGSYKLGSKISLAANLGVYYSLDATPNDGVRLNMSALSVSARHASLYKDEDFTGINVSGAISLAQNLGMGLANTPRLPTLGLTIGLSRSLGPVKLSYSIGFSKFFPVSTIGYSKTCAEQRGGQEYCYSGYEMNWQIMNSLGASYSPLETLHISAGLAFNNGRSYAPSTAGETTSGLNTVLTNRRDGFGFNLGVAWDTPVENLGVSLALTNGRPWRTNGQILPFFDFNYGLPLFFDTRFAAMSLDLSYTF